MGHLPIVDQKTLPDIIKTGYVSLHSVLKKKMVKTLADIFSDVLTVRPGDSIFPWIIAGKKSPNRGFEYEFFVDSGPIYVKGDPYPIKVKLRKEYVVYNRNLIEEYALDLFRQSILWNAIGKKSLGRGRGLTHQTTAEDLTMRQLLGQGVTKTLSFASYSSQPIKIDLNQTVDNLGSPSTKTGIWKHSAKKRISNLNLADLQWVTADKVTFEKVLEAWIMENLDVNNSPIAQVFPKNASIEWFGNYLPFGVTGRNIDVVATLNFNGSNISYVFELKKDGVRGKQWAKVIEQVFFNAEFISKALFGGQNQFVYPVILCHKSGKFDHQKCSSLLNFYGNPISLWGYEVSNGGMIISKI